MARILFTRTFAASFLRTNLASRWQLYFSGAVQTFSSNHGVLLDTSLTSQRRASIFNHLGVTPFLPKVWRLAIFVLAHSALAARRVINLSAPASYSRFFCLSAPRSTWLVTLRRLDPHHAVNGSRSLFITEFNVNFWAYPSLVRSGANISLSPLCVFYLCSCLSIDAAPTPAFHHIASISDPTWSSPTQWVPFHQTSSIRR